MAKVRKTAADLPATMDHNPRYSRRVIELRNLPEDYWTPTLHKLKKDGVMPDLTQSEGCRL
ncbi:unnamed protein product [Cylicostephanus goldi]|uniref:Uncharacterized protein n=1 Tax=Cylicostephanus goldi TaxID=71465 RepID=A0A3P7LX69_CYLGO|nr:unnamed protein product [Cylicostephanus goldi]